MIGNVRDIRNKGDIMNKSESIKALAVALTKAQSEIKSVKMDAVNPFFKSRYATLGAVIDASKEVLEKNGLVVTQLSTSDNGEVGITTLLMHSSGEWIESTCTVAIEGKNIAQEAGKAITYLRRYSLSSILNLYAEEDNDGQSPKKSGKTQEKRNSTQEKAKPDLDTPMSLVMANAVVGGTDKKKYKDCTNEELNGKLLGITKWLNNPENKESDKRESYLYKKDAIVTIRAYKEQG